MQEWRTRLVGAVALAMVAAPVASAAAAPAAPMPASVAKAPTRSAVIKVGGREHFGGHGFHHHHGHGGFGVGLGIGIIGGLLAAEAYNAPGYAPGYGYDEDVYDGPAPEDSGDPRELCAEKFRSFDWKTGLYTTHSGEKKLCPYLK